MPVEVTYPLLPDAVPDPGTAPGGGSGGSGGSSGGLAKSGLLTPFRRGPSDFVSGTDLALVQGAVKQVLGTRATSPQASGELPWRGGFGSLVHLLRHRNINATTSELARVWCSDALARWVPRVRIRSVDVRREDGPVGAGTVLLIAMLYDIVGSRGEILTRDVSQSVSLREAA